MAVGDVRLLDGSGRVLLKLEGVRLQRVPRDWLARRLAGPLPDWCYELLWTPQPLDMPSDQAAIVPGSWLIFDSPDGVGAALARRLEMEAHACTLVPAGADPESRRGAVREFLCGTASGRRGIVYLSGLEVNGWQEAPDFAAARHQGWGGVLDVVHVLAESTGTHPPRLWLVTRGAQAVGDRPLPLNLAHAPVWGLGRVIAAEHPALACTRIDLDPENRQDAADQLLEDLWWGQGEDQIAYRDKQRFVARLRRMARAEHMGKVATPAAVHQDSTDYGFSLREDGSYLVTGGLGGLGLKVAHWLADRGARYVVLVGRSSASPQTRSQHDQLEKAGVRVVIRRCDVSNREEVAELLSAIRRDLPPLRGVFHLAGVLDDGLLREQTRERFDRVMAAKVLGAWNLHELTREQPVDVFVLFSSAAALLGSPGQGNYAAANAFLDALAHHRRWEKRPALSVNWGAWSEVGMAAERIDAEAERWSAAGIGWIEPAQGLHTLEELLVDDRIQAGVLPLYWPKFLSRIPPGGEPAWLADIARDARMAAAPGAVAPTLLEELNHVTPAERRELVLTYLRKHAARVLAMDDASLPDPRRTLNELGFDSLTAVEFASRVSLSIGQYLNPALLFDHPTLERLAGYVVRDVLQLESAAAPPANVVDEAVEGNRAEVLADVEGMSEEDMDALVFQQLEHLQQ